MGILDGLADAAKAADGVISDTAEAAADVVADGAKGYLTGLLRGDYPVEAAKDGISAGAHSFAEHTGMINDVRVPGTNGGDIYRWFHTDAKGSDSLQAASNDWNHAGGQYGDAATIVQNAMKEAGVSWHGQSSDAAQAGISPIANYFRHANDTTGTAATVLGNQSTAFHDARNAVTEVPADPPQNNILNKIWPGTTDLDREIADYKANTAANQRAYQTYIQGTGSNVGEVPTFDSTALRGSTFAVRDKLIDDLPVDQHHGDHRGGGGGTRPPGGAGGGGGQPHNYQPLHGGDIGNQPGQVSQHQPSPAGSPGLGQTNPSAYTGGTPPPVTGGQGTAGSFASGGIPGTDGTSHANQYGSGAGIGALGGGLGDGASSSARFGAFGAKGLGEPGAAWGAATGEQPGAGGRTGAGAPGRPGAVAEGTAARPGAAGARSAAPGGMMGSPGQGGKGEDAEHRTSYLVEEDANELFGTDERTPPPVIGG